MQIDRERLGEGGWGVGGGGEREGERERGRGREGEGERETRRGERVPQVDASQPPAFDAGVAAGPADRSTVFPGLPAGAVFEFRVAARTPVGWTDPRPDPSLPPTLSLSTSLSLAIPPCLSPSLHPTLTLPHPH